VDPTLLQRHFGWAVHEAGFLLGSISLVCGMLGTWPGALPETRWPAVPGHAGW
jgi:hypothetical protein